MHPLLDRDAMFAAKALILKADRDDLAKHLDVSACATGDIICLRNPVWAFEAPAPPVPRQKGLAVRRAFG